MFEAQVMLVVGTTEVMGGTIVPLGDGHEFHHTIVIQMIKEDLPLAAGTNEAGILEAP